MGNGRRITIEYYPIGYISDGVACVGLTGALGAICNGLLSGRETSAGAETGLRDYGKAAGKGITMWGAICSSMKPNE